MTDPRIRPLEDTDEHNWRNLWSGYNRFYDVDLPDETTRHTWRRLLDPDVPIFGRVAEFSSQIIGFVHYVLHDGTWTTTPNCYLEDLFVDPAHRRRGVARHLIDDLVATSLAEGWSRLYWHTEDTNPARALYDQFTPADRFVRYRLMFPEPLLDA
ncbi:MAG: GNAT family N-acetyltransferase [Sphingomonas sp.]